MLGDRAEVNGHYLERVARQFGREFWTPGEVVYYCFREAEGLEPSDKVPAIRDSVSPALLKLLQDAALRVLKSMGPDADYFGLGFVAPEAPPVVTEIPRSFVEALSTDDAPA